MQNNFNVTGRLISKTKIQQITEKFRKVDFIVQLEDGKFPIFAQFQLANKLTNLIDGINVGDNIQVSFNLQGRITKLKDGSERVFNTLNAFSILTVENNQIGIDEDLDFLK